MNEAEKLRKAGGLMAMAACVVTMFALTQYAVAAHAQDTQSKPATAASAATGVVIGAFEGKAETSKQYGTYVLNQVSGSGWGWATTDDRRAGGHSSAAISLVQPGAGDTRGALQVGGEVKSGFISPWAGAVWFPGSAPMQPADLSGHKTLTFEARGQPGSYSVMLMAGSAHSVPLYASFTLTKDWKSYSIPLVTSFPGADLKHVYFIAFSAEDFGTFQFDLDNVVLR